MLRCWRGIIEAHKTRGGAQRINAGQDRTDVAIDNRGRRYVGGGVDNVTHRILPGANVRRAERNETETIV
jgi:hypothetical protein